MENSDKEVSQEDDISKTLQVTENDETILLDIFPEEVWLAVFKKLKPEDDFLQISNSSPFFRKLLKSQRTLFLFSKVWQILGMVYETSHDPVYMEHKVNQEQSMAICGAANIQPKTKWFSGILKYRQVCKTWCSEIDNFYRNFPDIYRMKQDIKSNWTRNVWGYGAQYGEWTRKYYLWFTDDLRKFQEHFSATHEATDRSPFLANAVSLKINLQIVQHQCEVLELYGKHVWHCHLGVQDDNSQLYFRLVELLKLMPNLRSLRIWYDLRILKHVEELEILIITRSLPTWQNLRFLEADNIPGAVFDNLLKMNNHVQVIEASREDENVQLYFNIFSHELPNLSEVSLEIHSREYFEQLKNSPFEWKLEKIYLNFSECRYIPWSEIFQILESKWAETATNVVFHLPRAITCDEKDNHISDLGSLQLSLCKLKRLKIVLENATTIDFILPMKDTLVQLEITETQACNEDMNTWMRKGFQGVIENQIIQFSSFQKIFSFYLSNIWTLLPTLQHLEYENESETNSRKIFTRSHKMLKYAYYN